MDSGMDVKKDINGVRKGNNVFIARQPIFDRSKKTYGYELLFRKGFENYCSEQDGDFASNQTLSNSFFVLGMDEITGGKKAFINFTRNLILNETASFFPSDLIAIEILENIVPDDMFMQACRSLKKKGYKLVLDDFILSDEVRPLIDVADIIKIDFHQSKPSDISYLSSLMHKRVKFLAEKVETREQFEEAYDLGYSFFQGYFFSKPIIIAGRDIPGYKINYLNIITEINKSEADFGRLEVIIKHDLSLSYKFLQLINSAAFGFYSKITSVKQALALLGINEFKKWISLIAMTGLGDDKPRELIELSIVRARFCEEVARYLGLREEKTDLFFMGMFSLIDAFIDRPLDTILKELPMSQSVKLALMGKKNRYRAVYEMLLAYEQGFWDRFKSFATLLNIEEEEVARIYRKSISWANNLSAST